MLSKTSIAVAIVTMGLTGAKANGVQLCDYDAESTENGVLDIPDRILGITFGYEGNQTTAMIPLCNLDFNTCYEYPQYNVTSVKFDSINPLTALFEPDPKFQWRCWFFKTTDDLCMVNSTKSETTSHIVDYTSPIQSSWPVDWKDIAGWNCKLINSTISGLLNSTTYNSPSLPTPTGIDSATLPGIVSTTLTESDFTFMTESLPMPTGDDSTTRVETTDSASMTDSLPTPTGDESLTAEPTTDSTSPAESLSTDTGDESTTLMPVTLMSTTPEPKAETTSTAEPARH